MEKAKGQYVYLGDYCGRVEQVDRGTLYIRIDDVSLHGKAREHFQPLHEQGTEVPAERIWADGAGVRITAYRYDTEQRVIRMGIECTPRLAGTRDPYRVAEAFLPQAAIRGASRPLTAASVTTRESKCGAPRLGGRPRRRLDR